MRQIKFRAQDIASNKWLYGDLRHHKDDVCIFEQGSTKGEQVKRDTVGQFTGLLDKNGKEIYESDIILLGKNKTYTAQIVYRNDSLRIYSVGGYFIGDLDYIRQCGIDYCEVIGNIHDNPEMVDEIKEKV